MSYRFVAIRFLISLSFLFAAAPRLLAVDGVIEISQVGIDQAGGFPLVIANSGSYRLTSNLTVTTENVNAINVGSENLRFVTIDLNGFVIRGTGSGSGSGISAFAVGLTVRNGTIEGFGGSGIFAGGSLIAEGVTVAFNGVRGIDAGGPSTLRNVTARDNTVDGAVITSGLVTGSVFSGNDSFGLRITSGTGAVMGGYSNNTFILNTAGTVNGGVNLGGNLCESTTCP